MHDRTTSFFDKPQEDLPRLRWWPFGKRKKQSADASAYSAYLESRWGDGKVELTDADIKDTKIAAPSKSKFGWLRLPKWIRRKNSDVQIGESDVPKFWEDGKALVKKRRSRWWWISRGFGAFTLLFLLLLLWLAITAPLSKSLQPIAPPQITLTASDGTPIARNGAIVDKPVKIADLPPHVPNAFLAIEDRNFYSHIGISAKGLARALWTNLTSDRTQGGSTITQQLAKFTFLNSDQTLTRKGRELLIAFWLEARLSKDEILERYLSNAYFGDNVYGLRAASLHYFHRQPERLKPEQAMMLAGLLKAPSRLAPTKNLEAAQERARVVRGAMVTAGFMTQANADKLPLAKIDVRAKKSNLPTGTYFADWAMPQARAISDYGYARQTLTTTLDARLQHAARRAIGRAGLGNAQIGLVAMKPTGEVVAMVGGRDYSKSAFNRVTQAKRQPGSTFKTFVWLAALQSGMEPEDMVDDSEITQGSYRPKNSGGRYRGEITLKEAFARSSNVAAVRLFNEIGDKKVIETARDFGVTSKLPAGDPSIALGTSTMTLLELTAAYAGIAGNSMPVEPRAFETEEEGWFDWLFNRQDSMSGRVHDDMQEMLRYAVNKGTGRAAQLRIVNYGKTGTSQDNRDAIFVGYAGNLVVGVWVGNDDNSPLKGVSGGGKPARIWRDFMTQAVKGAGYTTPAKPKKKPKVNEPVKPLDLPEIPELSERDIRVGNSDIRLENEGVVFSTEIDGLPIDIELNEEGLDVRRRGGE